MGFSNLFLQLVFLLTHLQSSAQWCLFATYYEPNGNQIFEIDWSPDGSYIVTAAASGKLSVISFATSNVVWSDTLSNDVYTAKFSKNGKWLGVGQLNTDTIRIYNVPAFTLNMSFSAGHASTSTTINELDFSYDNTKIVTCGSDGFVNQRTISPFSATTDWRTVIDNTKSIVSCKYASSGKVGISGTDNNMHVLRSTGNIQDTQSKSGVKDVDFRAYSDVFLYGACTDNKLYEMDTSGSGSTLRTAYSGGDEQWAVSYALDSTFAVTAGKSGNIYILTMTGTTTPAPLQQRYVTGANVNSVRVSDDSNFIAVGRVDGVIPIYARVCMNSCPYGFYFNVTTCRMCSADIIGCTSCLNSTVCYTCNLGYYLNTATNTCKICDYAIKGCQTCKSSTVCLSCDPNYYLSAPNACTNCDSLVPNCEQCLDNGTCLKCSSFFYLTATSTCADCKLSIINCLSCALEVNISSPTGSTLYCRQCTQGYYASQAQCLACSTGCDHCTSSNVCIGCAQEYKLSGTTCVKCNQYCEACTEAGTCLDCIPTTYLSGGTCTVCSAPCLTCSVSATNCTTCMLDFWMSGTNTCTRCTGCTRCHPVTGACLACPLGQYISATNTCLNCLNTTSHCAICTLSTCQVCERNFYLSGTSCLLSASVTSCQIYQKNSVTVCEHCAQAFYLDTGVCNPCPTGCLVCENSTFCSQCQIEYYITASNTCTACSGNCKTCTSSSQCLSCGDEYYLSGTSCLLCSSQISNCNSCLNSTHCVDCSLGYQLASNSLSCTMCVSPCTTCNAAGCLSCELGYFYTTSTCTRCPSACSICTSLTTCKSCVPGYALDGTNACVSCGTLFSNCLACNSTACFGCIQYYQFNAGVCTTCASGITNCLNCNNAGLCSLCVVGFYPATNKLSCLNCSSAMANCEKCASATVCDKCLSGYYPSAVNVCSKCMEGCYTCNTATTCILCSAGFVLVSGVCKECDQYVFGCQSCTLASGCLSCQVGYYLASSTSCPLCRTAMQGCAVCSSSTVCVSCDLGYFINGTNKCQSCSTVGCATCNPVTSVCTTCMVGYFFNTSAQCQLCSVQYPDCGVCNSAVCLRCDSGSYLSSGACTKCTTIHQACILCNNTNCLQCESGYYLPAAGTCQVCNILGCQVCSPTGTTCLSCENLYYRTGTTCSLCQSMNFGCLSCSALNSCILCKTGYYLSANGTCLLCSSLFTGCDICTSTRCQTCKTNYFYNASSVGGDCILCNNLLPGCSLCLNQAQCLLCESGYYLNAMQCSSCTSINQCLVCQDASTCLFCASGYYLNNGTCLSCSAAIPGCFSCASSALCQTCSGSFTLSSGQCVEVKGTPPQTYTEIRIVSEYVNATHLKHILYSSAAKFVQIQQNWNQVTKIQLILPPNNKTTLTILGTEWGSTNASNSLIFYTNNPFGQVNSSNGANSMPMVKQFTRRVLLTLQELNIKVNFNMMKAAITQILPTLDTSGQDLALQYKLNNPEFYKSVVANEKHYFYLFGVTVTGLLLFGYFIKICCVIPMTRDTGDIIPHVLLTKVPAMVIYPSLGGYIDYCYGFTYIDVPFFNTFFSNTLTDQTDTSPNSYRMFYQNLNIASTYLTALIIFAGVYGILTIYTLIVSYRNRNKSLQPAKRGKAGTENVSLFDQPYDRIQQFRSYFYNIFQAGLAFSSVISIVGMVYNPSSVVTASGSFYILSVVVYTLLLVTAIKSFITQKNSFNQIRIMIKATIMGLLFLSPVALFVVLVVVDGAILAYQYKLKIKQWVVPKIWIVSHALCLTSYGVLIFLSNMSLGLIISSVCIVTMLIFDLYLQYAEHLEVEKIRDLQQKSKQYTENNLSIEDFIPEKQKQPDSRQNDFYFNELENNRNEPKKSNRVADETFSKSQGITASSFSLNFSTAKASQSKKAHSFTIRGLNQ